METITRTEDATSANQIMRAVTTALCAGLFVLVCFFGAPDGQNAAQIDGVELDAHSDALD